MKKLLLATSIALLGSTTVIAEERPPIEAFLGIDGTEWEQSKDLEKENGVDVGFGYNVSKNWAIEGWYGRNDTKNLAGSNDILVETASIAALFHLAEGPTRPFLSFGASKEMFNPEVGVSSSDETVDFGVGLKHYFDNNVVLRGDLIARTFDSDIHDVNFDKVARLSIGYAFGSAGRSVSKTKDVPAAPVTPTPAKPVDSDGDGIYDSADKCPATPMKLKVDENGCKVTLTETVRIDLNIQFPNNSDEITDSYLAEIQQVAQFMSKYEGTVVQVMGYTDDRGSEAYNQQLSEKRAKSVASKLVNAFGIAESRVSAIGYGEENPIADNATAEGRAKNRRVVAEVSTKVQKDIVK